MKIDPGFRLQGLKSESKFVNQCVFNYFSLNPAFKTRDANLCNFYFNAEIRSAGTLLSIDEASSDSFYNYLEDEQRLPLNQKPLQESFLGDFGELVAPQIEGLTR